VGGVENLGPVADELAVRSGAQLGILVDRSCVAAAADGKAEEVVTQRLLNYETHGVLSRLRKSCPKKQKAKSRKQKGGGGTPPPWLMARQSPRSIICFDRVDDAICGRVDDGDGVARLAGDVDPFAVRTRGDAFRLGADDERGDGFSVRDVEDRRGRGVFIRGEEPFAVRRDGDAFGIGRGDVVANRLQRICVQRDDRLASAARMFAVAPPAQRDVEALAVGGDGESARTVAEVARRDHAIGGGVDDLDRAGALVGNIQMIGECTGSEEEDEEKAFHFSVRRYSAISCASASGMLSAGMLLDGLSDAGSWMNFAMFSGVFGTLPLLIAGRAPMPSSLGPIAPWPSTPGIVWQVVQPYCSMSCGPRFDFL